MSRKSFANDAATLRLPPETVDRLDQIAAAAQKNRAQWRKLEFQPVALLFFIRSTVASYRLRSAAECARSVVVMVAAHL
jgi:hypothetical protein